jgi:hypothetical protein
MAFYKQKKKQDEFKQTVFSNQAEKRFVQQKKFYALIKINDGLFFEEYPCKFRSEANEYFNEVARLNGGKVDTFSVLK